MNRCIFVTNFFILGCIQRISSQASGTPHNLKVTTRSPLWVFLPKRQKFHLEIWMESGKSKVLLSGKFKRRNDGNWKLDFFKAPICPPLPSAPLQPLKCLGSNLQNQCISSPLRSGRWGTPTPKNMVTEWGVFHCSWCVCVCMESCYTFMSIFATSTPLAHENSPSRAEILHPCRISSRIYNYYSYPVTRNHDTEMTMITIS